MKGARVGNFAGHRAVVFAGLLACAGCDPGLHVGAIKQTGVPQLVIDGLEQTRFVVTVGASERLPGLSVRNTGSGTAHDVRVALGATPLFVLSSDGCAGASLGAGESCPFQITVSAVAGGPFSTEVTAAAAEGTASTTVNVTASGLFAALDGPTPLSAASGCPSIPATIVQVTNQGHLASVLSAPILSPGLRSAQGSSCVPGNSLAPGEQCVLSVAAVPPEIGMTTESVSIAGAPGGTATVTLLAVGQPDFVVDPPALALHSPSGGPVSGILTVLVGATPRPGFDVGGAPAGFQRSHNCPSTSPACSSCQILVTFSPVAGTFAPPGALMVYSAGTVISVPLTGS